jgi:SAM-dependent methyltransferase
MNALRHLAAQLRKLLLPVNRRSARARLGELRNALSTLLRIDPLFVASDQREFVEASAGARLDQLVQAGGEALRTHPADSFRLRRLCLCCNEMMPMLVDYQFGGVQAADCRMPNWRERLLCPGCEMNNRQRLVAKLVQQSIAGRGRPRIYMMEQVTPIFEWVRRLDAAEVHGSEYLGHGYKGGTSVKGIRHEDVMALSYPDASFDLIVSNDVMEHIPEPVRALQECFRVLRPGGLILATFPFNVDCAATQVRARLADGIVEHLLPPQFHGNPVSAEGSLVFQDFGWDLLDTMRAIGFSTVQLECYGSDTFGHLGSGLHVFHLRKPQRAA